MALRAFKRDLRLFRIAGLSWCGLLGSLSATASKPPSADVAINRPDVALAFPLSVRAGHAADVTFRGNYLDEVQGIRCDCADLKTTILSGNPLEIKARIESSASANPGPRFLVVETPKGPSNRILFRVTDWPSILESEPNDSYAEAQSVPTPVMVEGMIETVHDSDMFRFRASAGERLAFNVLTGRSKVRGHVVAILMTASGRVLSRNLSYFGTDPYLDYTFAENGDYILTVIPRRFSDFYTILSDDTKINWQYELAIGRSPILWSVFPMGGKRGATVEVELRADFLPPEAEPQFSTSKLSASMEPIPDPCACRYKLAVNIAEDTPLGTHYLSFPDPSGTLMPMAFSVGDTPESVEQEPNDGLHEGQRVSLPLVLNGRIDGPGDIDGILFTVNQYDELAFEVDAKGLGSHITDPNLTLVRPDGELIDRGDDRCTDCGQYFNAVRRKEKLDSKFWHYFQTGNPNDADAAGDYVLQLRDNSKRGGPDHAYRLKVRKRVPGFRIGVLQESVRGPLGGVARIPVTLRSQEGFKGMVDVHADGLPPGMVAEALQLRTDAPSGILKIRHDADTSHPGARTGLRDGEDRRPGSDASRRLAVLLHRRRCRVQRGSARRRASLVRPASKLRAEHRGAFPGLPDGSRQGRKSSDPCCRGPGRRVRGGPRISGCGVSARTAARSWPGRPRPGERGLDRRPLDSRVSGPPNRAAGDRDRRRDRCDRSDTRVHRAGQLGCQAR